MALGTISVGVKAQAVGPMNVDLIAFAGDGAYPTGGSAGFQALVRAKLGRGDVEVVGVIAQDCGGYVAVYDYANDKLKCYDLAGFKPATIASPNASDLATAETLVNEIKAALNAISTPVPSAEVPNTTNLSATAFHLLVVTK